MKERPILFGGPMVKAILEGRKTQTRRVCKIEVCAGNEEEGDLSARKQYLALTSCPFGVVGDRLWVKEAWRVLEYPKDSLIADQQGGHTGRSVLVQYRAGDLPSDYGEPLRAGNDREHKECPAGFCPIIHDATPRSGKDGKWQSSLFMPRWASRITLEITEIRVQRLQDITANDAVAEGVPDNMFDCYGPACPLCCNTLGCKGTREGFEDLWDSINGKKHPWESNPWVWAISFKRVVE